ncbi:pantetheinase-like [Littorina saxatilis]|uniref:CN hydrolase domain-containing protein n=1 Tax=Littorina saxatilis TaxID=31220 RepID=A0AAN9BV91_9CAEN
MSSQWTIRLVIIVTSLAMTSALTMRPSGYIAAVYAHRPVLPPHHNVSRPEAVHNMMQNLNIYEQQTRTAAKQGAQIIVFPEDGLYGYMLSRSVIRTYLEPIPDPLTITSWVPCTDPGRVSPSDVLQYLSCMARNNSMYVVANMGDIQPCTDTKQCPPDGHYQYNTDVVFDSAGQLVARYHKRTLFGEKMFDPGFSSGSMSERITFDTPFAGPFGVFTCFDILFYDPAVHLVEQGFKNFVFPTAWMDSYPFLDAVGFHSAWARRHGINLLAANLQLPENRFAGTGVYSATGPVGYYYNKTAGSDGRLVVVDVPAGDDVTAVNKGEGNVKVPEVKSEKVVPIFQTPIRRDTFNLVEVNEASGQTSVCMENTCCSLSYRRSEFDPDSQRDHFALGAFQGVHNSKRDWYFEACVLVRCTSNSGSTCGALTWDSNTLFSFNMTAQLSSGAAKYIYPEVLVANNGQVALTLPREWQFDQGGVLKVPGLTRPLLAAALYARDYSKDPSGEDVSDTRGADLADDSSGTQGFVRGHNLLLCVGSVAAVLFCVVTIGFAL